MNLGIIKVSAGDLNNVIIITNWQINMYENILHGLKIQVLCASICSGVEAFQSQSCSMARKFI